MVWAMLPLLASCGKNTEALRSELIGCTAHLQIIGMMTLRGGPDADFARKVDAATAGEGSHGAALVQLGNSVAATLDPAKMTALAREGADLARRQAAAGDVTGAASHVKDCLASYEQLVAASR